MSGRRILVADDEMLFRTSVADSLRGRFKDVDVLEAEDGQSAVEVLERHAVDVLITDLKMPRLGGIGLIAYVSSHHLPIQVLVVSAHIDDTMRGTLDDLGALACIDKPIDLERLHAAVQRMLAVPRAHVSGVALSGFLQLIEMERQSCAVRVASPDGTGTLVFRQGQLVDAWTGEVIGDDAAIAILRFRDCTLDSVGVVRESEPRTTLPLSFLLLEAARKADEDRRDEGPEPEDSLGSKPETRRDDEPSSPPPSIAEEKLREKVLPLVKAAMAIQGTQAAVVVDFERGVVLCRAGRLQDLDIAEMALANAKIFERERRLTAELLGEQVLEEVLINLSEEVHMLRTVTSVGPSALMFLVVDRKSTTVALARTQLGGLEKYLAKTGAEKSP